MGMDKTQLQWLLAVIGAIVVVLIYLWGIRARIREGIRKRRRRPPLDEPVLRSEDSASLPDPLLNAHDFGELGRITPDHHLADKALVDVEVLPIRRSGDPPAAGAATGATGAADMAAPARREPSLSTPPKMTVLLTVMAPSGRTFQGSRIRAAVGTSGFRLGATGLFERYSDSVGGDAPIFSLAHLREPGTFDLRTLDDLSTPGLLLFMKLPGPLAEIKALDLLMLSADQLARELGGVIGDERRNRMTQQALLHLRSQVMDLERRRRLWAQSP